MTLQWHKTSTTQLMKPIETRAYGCRFRSRLEARYAVFMTELRVKWNYEPEGFDLPSGPYLPDFFLPKINGGTWLEIKPHGIGSYFGFAANTKPDARLSDRRLNEFSNLVHENGQQFYIAYGLPCDDYLFSNQFPDYEMEGMLEASCDSFMWCVCGCGKTAGIEFDGRSDRINCKHDHCVKSDHGDKGYSHDHPLIVQAAMAARSARFEHGEQP